MSDDVATSTPTSSPTSTAGRVDPVATADGNATVVAAATPDRPAAAPQGRWAAWKARTTGGAPLFPLGVLFGLNVVDELDRAAFGVLTPNIRDHFGLDLTGILTVISLSYVAAFLLAVPIGFYADRLPRIPIMVVGASLWCFFSVTTGLAATIWMLGISRAGAGLGRAVNDPVHNALLADYYDIPVRPRVYSIHRYANALGQFIGPLAGGLIAYYTDWRVPFFVFAIATAVFIVLAMRLRDPVRGQFERRAVGVSDEVAGTEETPPSWAESWRVVWQVRSQRRIFMALPFVAIGLIGLLVFSGLFYEEVFGLDERERGFLAALIEGPAQLAGLLIGIPLATKLMMKGPGHVLQFLSRVSAAVSAVWVVFALAPNLAVAVAANALISLGLFLLLPGIFAVMSLAIPAKVRSFGYAVGLLWILPGFLLLPIIGVIGEAHGLRVGLMAAAPVFLIGGLIVASGGSFVADDITRVWRTAATLSEVAHLRSQGKVKLLLARDVAVHYGSVQVLFGVNLEVDEGEVVALLGTNGAGKSTLLRAISGQVQASDGAIIFDGRDMTHTPPDEVAKRGVAQVPGGQGVFTQLSVADNLRLAAWQVSASPQEARIATERVLETFPILRERWDVEAGNLSGGQQQMLTLGMAFIGKPRLLMIDELSLGLSPAVVGQLLEMVRLLKQQGTTIILVEQSVNVALTVAERAYFMEKGEIRFEGPAADLLARPDLLRSVFFSAGANGRDGELAAAAIAADGPAPDAAAIAASAEAATRVVEEAAAAVAAAGTNGDDDAAALPAAVTVIGNGSNGAGAGVADVVEVAPVLEVRDLVKRFGGVRALDGVSFDVRPDEILGFIGPNGAGKTTLFDLISGFVSPDIGRVTLDGVDISDRMPDGRARLGLGRSFQDARLFPALTVDDTIALALERRIEVRDPIAAALNLPAVAASELAVGERVEELIELMGLGAFRDKFIAELSTGSRRIVDLACVLAHEPKVLLFDEPSSGIAQRETEALGPLLLRIREQTGASLLVIEHDMPLITSISDELLALDLGRTVVRGLPHEVVHDERVVTSYLGGDQAVITRSGSTGSGGDSADSADGERPRPTTRRRPAAPAKKAAKKAATTVTRRATPASGAAKKTTVRKSATKKTTTAKKAAASRRNEE
jgi:branched-chain amino acid transport system ATP-binding protein